MKELEGHIPQVFKRKVAEEGGKNERQKSETPFFGAVLNEVVLKKKKFLKFVYILYFSLCVTVKVDFFFLLKNQFITNFIATVFLETISPGSMASQSSSRFDPPFSPQTRKFVFMCDVVADMKPLKPDEKKRVKRFNFNSHAAAKTAK